MAGPPSARAPPKPPIAAAMAPDRPPPRTPAAALTAFSTARASSASVTCPSAAARASDRVRLAPARPNASSIEAAARSAGSFSASSAAAASAAFTGTASIPSGLKPSVIRPHLLHSLQFAAPQGRRLRRPRRQHPPLLERQPPEAFRPHADPRRRLHHLAPRRAHAAAAKAFATAPAASRGSTGAL